MNISSLVRLLVNHLLVGGWLGFDVVDMFFRDPNEIKRTAAHISWFPDGPKKLAIAYCNLDFQGSAPDSNMESYIWDVGE